MSVNFDTVKQMVHSMPLKTGTQVFLDSSAAQRLDTKNDDATINKAKSVGRGIATYIALPFFAGLGAAYNTVAAVAKGITGTVALLQKGKEDPEVRALFESAVEHLSFAVYDFVMTFLSLVAAPAYGYDPELVAHYHNKATGEGAVSRAASPEQEFAVVESEDDAELAPKADKVQNMGLIRENAHHYFDVVAVKAGLAPKQAI